MMASTLARHQKEGGMRFYGIANSEGLRSFMGKVDAFLRDLREQPEYDKRILASDYEEREAFGLKMDSQRIYLTLLQEGNINQTSEEG